MKFGLLNVLALVSVVPLAVALNACGDDSSTSSPAAKLPTEVKDLKELEEHKCDMSVIGEKVFVESEDLLYECDGDAWFKSYDQTKPSSSSAKSSSSMKADGSSDSKNSDKDGSSSSDATTSSSSAKSSSSHQTEILEPEITVNETCTEVGACDAMVKTDISTWHFVRKDNFGDDAEYTYTVDGKDLIVTIKSADGSTDSKTYSMYNMESDAGVEMAFNAAKSTCKNGGGNEHTVMSCVKDSVRTMPDCNKDIEGYIGLDGSVYRICKSDEWRNASNMEIDTYGKECVEGSLLYGKVDTSKAYICDGGVFRTATDLEKDTDGEECVEGRMVRGKINKNRAYTCEKGKFRNATTFELDIEGQECVDGAVVWGNINTNRAYTCDGGKFRISTTIEVDTEGEECIDERVVHGKINVDSVYVCDGDKFRLASSIEKAFGAMCTAKVEGRVAKDDAGNKYYCTSSTWKNIMAWSWDVPKEARLNPEIKYGTMTDDRDGKVYKTVQIGKQLWLAENMNYDFPGDDKVSIKISKNSLEDENGAVAGSYYTYQGALNACPVGWHLPDTNEWKELFDYVGGQDVAATALRSQTGWREKVGSYGDETLRFGTDDVGFSAIAAGSFESYYAGNIAFFWGLDTIGEYVSAGVGIQPFFEQAFIEKLDWFSYYPVRCIKGFYWDSTVVPGKMTDNRDGNVYRTIRIGNQEWMAENLIYADSMKTPSLKKMGVHSWDDPERDLRTATYTWAAAIDSVALYNNGKGIVCGKNERCDLPARLQGICPNGWRLPSKEDWETLISAAGDSIAGWVLKAPIGWKELAPGINGLGFSAKCSDQFERSIYWSMTEQDEVYSYGILFGSKRRDAVMVKDDKFRRNPVRCLRDL